MAQQIVDEWRSRAPYSAAGERFQGEASLRFERELADALDQGGYPEVAALHRHGVARALYAEACSTQDVHVGDARASEALKLMQQAIRDNEDASLEEAFSLFYFELLRYVDCLDEQQMFREVESYRTEVSLSAPARAEFERGVHLTVAEALAGSKGAYSPAMLDRVCEDAAPGHADARRCAQLRGAVVMQASLPAAWVLAAAGLRRVVLRR